MSILGYSASYFLPEYWANTPFYGEKIIPVLDYALSTDFGQADKLANAFYMMENKYKNTSDLPIGAIEAIIEESGYSYVKDLLGNDEDSIRLLVYLLVLIHQLKGTKLGIEVVLNLLRRDTEALTMGIVGKPTIDLAKNVSNFSLNDYVYYSGFTVDNNAFSLTLQFRTNSTLNEDQCIISSGKYGFRIGINDKGNLTLSLGSDREGWNILPIKQSIPALSPGTNYYLKFSFDGYDYLVDVSKDNKKFNSYISYSSNESLNIHQGTVYIGLDYSSGVPKTPYKGSINLTPFSTDVQGINITQWFEGFPVGNENTFTIKADLDVSLVSSDFFKNFGNFINKYVYPTLSEFEARLAFKSNLTFLPYVRQNIDFVALGNLMPHEGFYTSELYRVRINNGEYFDVLPSD